MKIVGAGQCVQQVEAEHSQSAEIHVPVVFINFHNFDNERIGYTSYL